MIVGIAGFLVLVPLAITSTSGWKRRLGKRWRTLHWLVYAAGPLSVLHFYWLDRDIQTVPLSYAAVVAALLALRVPAVRRTVVQARYRLLAGRAKASQPATPGQPSGDPEHLR